MPFSTAIARPLQLGTRVLQWASAVIVMGLTSYFISLGARGEHILYQEVIAVISVVFFLPAFLSPFLPTALSKYVLAIDIIFSYLWLTSFIFSAQKYYYNYSTRWCHFLSPSGISCNYKNHKKANEAFIFLAFVFTFFGMFLEVAALWAHRQGSNTTKQPVAEDKEAGPRQPLDAPAATPVGAV